MIVANTPVNRATTMDLSVALSQTGDLIYSWNHRSEYPSGGNVVNSPELRATGTTMSDGKMRNAISKKEIARRVSLEPPDCRRLNGNLSKSSDGRLHIR